MRRLNVWERLGVVLSVLWVICASVALWWFRMDKAMDDASVMYRECMDPDSIFHKLPISDCGRIFQAQGQLAQDGFWELLPWVALTPILLGWGLAYLIFATVRWVLAGRRTEL